MSDRPIGRRFSLVYVPRGEPGSDSIRARNRVIAITQVWHFQTRDALAARITREIGVPMSRGFSELRSIALVDFLDAITVLYHALPTTSGNDFLEHAERIFREENLKYTCDEDGGVHYLVDAVFHAELDAGIAGLLGARYTAAKEALDRVQPSLDVEQTREAVRATFDAVENVFKILLGTSRLGASEIAKELRVATESAYDGAALNSHRLLLKGFGEWTNAAHQYRHMEGDLEAAPPPMDLAVLMISQGLSWLRWLISLSAITRVDVQPTT